MLISICMVLVARIQPCLMQPNFMPKKTGIIVNVHYGPQNKWNEDAKKNADILFGASEQSALAIIRDHKDSFSEKDIQPLYLRKKYFTGKER